MPPVAFAVFLFVACAVASAAETLTITRGTQSKSVQVNAAGKIQIQ